MKAPSLKEPTKTVGYPNGAFNRAGRWIPDGTHDVLADQVRSDLVYVRRHEALSPGGFLARLSRYRHSVIAATMLGSPTLGEMSGLEAFDDWSTMADAHATDFGCFLIHCGCPYDNHTWNLTGHWAPRNGKAVWE